MASSSGYGADGEFPSNSLYSSFNFSPSCINSLVRELEGDEGSVPLPYQFHPGHSGHSSSLMPPPQPRFPAENFGGITSNF